MYYMEIKEPNLKKKLDSVIESRLIRDLYAG